MGKVISEDTKGITFAKGGTGKMFGKGTAGRAVSDTSGKQSNSPSGGGDKFASGGSGKMFSKGHAEKAIPGQSGKSGQ